MDGDVVINVWDVGAGGGSVEGGRDGCMVFLQFGEDPTEGGKVNSSGELDCLEEFFDICDIMIYGVEVFVEALGIFRVGKYRVCDGVRFRRWIEWGWHVFVSLVVMVGC